MALALAAAHRRRLPHSRTEESLAFKPIERGIDRSHRHGAPCRTLHVLLDGHAVGVVAERADSQEEQLLELAEAVTLHEAVVIPRLVRFCRLNERKQESPLRS